MKKKFFIAVSAMASVVVSLYAASPRLDFFNKEGGFWSVLEYDLKQLVYFQELGAGPTDGVTHVRVETLTGNTTISLAECEKIVYAPATGLEPFAIDVITDDHCTVTMLDCMNNDGIIDPTKPNDWHGAESDYLCHFIYAPEYGYEMTVDIVGAYTGKVYTENPGFVFFVAAEDYAKWTDCWGFLMPNEPVTLVGRSTELTTYVGHDFIGLYNGYQICKEPRVSAPTETTLELELRANGSYVVKSTDDNAYDFHYMYSYDTEAGMARHIEIDKPKWDLSTVFYGATEKFLGDDFAYIDVTNYSTGKPEDTRFYLAAKAPFSFISAASEYGNQYVVEAKSENGTVKNLYINNYGASVRIADFDFKKGEHINEDCEVIVSYDGETRLKYIYNGVDVPEFIAKGLEAGTYVSANDIESEELVLDGFGGAVIGGVPDTYVIESGIVTLEAGTRTFMIDTEQMTYTEQLRNDEWTGPVEFIIENANGAYNNNESDRCVASIVFDKDLNGEDKKGYVALKIDLWDASMLAMRDMIRACPKYNYDKENSTIILSGVLVGTGSGFNTVKRNLVLRVSDDIKSIWFDSAANGLRIFGVSSPSDWFATGEQNTLVAKEVPAPTVSGRYEATFPSMLLNMGWGEPSEMPMEVKGVLMIDSDAAGTEKPGYAYFSMTAMGSTNLYADVVEYELTDNKLILKSLQMGTVSDGIVAGNLEFDITPEGYLQGTTTIYGNGTNTLSYGVNLNNVPFMPVTE